jgi:hypothetical protein
MGRLPLFLCFAAFLVTFLVTRLVVRLIRAGRGPFKNNVTDGGLHIHHAVPGVILLVAGAFLAVGATTEPWSSIAGITVGVGTALVLDEFALILHLDDVYWSEEGRTSVVAVALALGCLGLAAIGFNPFGIGDDDTTPLAIASAILLVVVEVALVLVCVRKGKYKLALFGAFVWPLSLIGAMRLARPTSRWARRRYDEDQVGAAAARAAAFDARWAPVSRRIVDLVAGAPTPVEQT